MRLGSVSGLVVTAARHLHCRRQLLASPQQDAQVAQVHRAQPANLQRPLLLDVCDVVVNIRMPESRCRMPGGRHPCLAAAEVSPEDGLVLLE